jgi:hypothetical protein
MPRYMIERELPGAGSLSDAEIRTIAAKSNRVLSEMGGDVQWDHSYVTDDKIYCVYVAADGDRVREHAHRGEFPANVVSHVTQVIDPTTGGR